MCTSDKKENKVAHSGYFVLFPVIELFTQMRKVSEKERTQYTNLYGELLPSLVQSAFGYTRSTEEAQDIVQDIFVGLWRRLQRRSIDNMKSYIYTSLRNRKIDFLRKKKTLSLDALMDKEVDPLQPEEHNESRDWKKSTKIVRGIIAKSGLSKQRRKIARLHFIWGLKPIEVAHETKIDYNSVCVDLHRIKAILRKSPALAI